MNKQTILITIIAVLAGVVVGYLFGFGGGMGKEWVHGRGGMMMHDKNYDDKEELPMGMHRMPDGSLMGRATADTDMVMHHMDIMVSSEQDFIEGMIPHHQEAVDTAKEVLARGGSTPEIKALAEGIIMAQETEIADMKVWYQDWYGKTYQDTGKYEPMMRDLSSLSGPALDKRFLEDMVMHHMGAIMMARSVEPYVEHQEVEVLTKAIVDTQTTEIQLMRRLILELN